MGTQIREMTDEMAKSHDGEPREMWISELEQSGLYLAHRSFPGNSGRHTPRILADPEGDGGGRPGRQVVMAMVLVQMLLGVVMAQVHIYAAVQVLHVGLAAVLLSGVVFCCVKLCGLVRKLRTQRPLTAAIPVNNPAASRE